MRLTAKGVLSLLGIVTLGVLAWAGDPTPTTITIEDMDCPACAKKVAGKVQAVPGVASVRADVPEARLTVLAKSQQAPSPRALWDAVTRAGFTPTRLEGPAGRFTGRPDR